MSDHHAPTPPEDRMRDTLTALRADTDRVGMHDATDVRRRGRARSRHQAIAGLAAAVIVVAVAIGGSTLAGSGGKHDPNTVATNPPTPKTLALAADPLLRAGDVAGVGPYESFRRNPDPVDEAQRPLQCMPSPTTLGAPESKSALFYSDLDATFIEHVLRFPDEAAASQAVDRLTAAFASCDKGKTSAATVEDSGPDRMSYVDLAGVSETLHASRLTTPKTDGEVSYYELGAIRDRNVVVVLEWSSMGDPLGSSPELVWEGKKLATAAERATH